MNGEGLALGPRKRGAQASRKRQAPELRPVERRPGAMEGARGKGFSLRQFRSIFVGSDLLLPISKNIYMPSGTQKLKLIKGNFTAMTPLLI